MSAPTKFFEALRAANDHLDAVARAQKAEAKLDETKAELDNVMYEFRLMGDRVAGLTNMNAHYHAERDDALEDRDNYRRQLDQVRDERDEALTRVQELEAEVAALRGEA